MKLIKKILFFSKNFIKYIRSGGVVYAQISLLEQGSQLKGKRILITGGTSGIGFAIAQKFLSQGAKVVITGRTQTRLDIAVAKLEGDVHSIVWDIADSSLAESKVSKVIELIGGIDILINNAGIYAGHHLLTVEEANWDSMMDTNLKGLYFVTQSVIKRMLETDTVSKIINISSITGIQGSTIPYGISKWGVSGFTKGLARDYVKRNILVNGIAPGVTSSDINGIDPSDNLFMDNLGYSNRVALSDEIAELALFLASDVSNHIVGQVIACDGGNTLI